MEHGEISPQGTEGIGTARRRGSPAEVQNDGNAIQSPFSHRLLQHLSVAIQEIGAGSRHTAAECCLLSHGRLPLQTGFHLGLTGGAEFGAIGPKHFDAVVCRGVMAGGDHQAAGGPQLADQQRNRRRRTEPKGPHIATSGRQAGRQGSNHHAAAGPGVHPDQNRTFRLQNPTDPIAHLKTQGGGENRAGEPTDSIGSKPWRSVTESGADRGTRLLNHGSQSWTAP